MSLEDLAKLLVKEGLASDHAEPESYIDTGIPQLNYAITGNPYEGLPEGRMTEIAGESQAGKTVLFSHLAIANQRQGGASALWDHEKSFKEALAVSQGLNPNPGPWLFKKGVSFEDSMVQSYKHGKFLRDNSHSGSILHGFDSFAAMIPKSQLEDGKGEKDMDAYTMNDTSALARVASTVLKVYKSKIDSTRITCVFLNQLAADMDISGGPQKGGPKVKSKGGKSLPFYADIRLFIKSYEIKEKGVLLGRKMSIQVKKNKIAMPGETIELDLKFDPITRLSSIDVLPSYIDFLKQERVFNVTGAWIEFNGEKFQGTQKLIDHYRALPDGLEQLKKLHKDWLDARAARKA